MKRLITTLFAGGLLALALFGVAAAGPFEDGKAAMDRSDYKEAMRLLRPLADQGSAEAENLVGGMYYYGWGVPQDFGQAATWTRKAAGHGFADAQNGLGWMFERGEGVPQDYVQAAMWWRNAADQGHAGAQYNLGKACFEGRVLPQDYVQAYMWLDLAASRDQFIHGAAAKARDAVAAKMTPAQIAEAQRMAREWAPK